MASKQPVIKFSPFEALLIGEKNSILRRQPMKNTIFVTKLNKTKKKINLRDLFGLDNCAKTKSDNIFKVPQQVSDFLKRRKLKGKVGELTKTNKNEVLCYEFEGCKMITRNNEKIKLREGNKKGKLKKVKFKRKLKQKEKFKDKVVKKFPTPIRKYHKESKINFLHLGRKKKIKCKSRHSLRGSDGKFICKSEFKDNKSKINSKQKYLSNYLHQLYLKKNKKLLKDQTELSGGDSSDKFGMPYSIKTIVGLPVARFDITASEATLNEVSKSFYKSNCLEDFQFPKYPKNLKQLDFDCDKNLIDIIYESFPLVIKFESKMPATDFSNALLDKGILKPEENLKINNEKLDETVTVKDKELKTIFGKRFPLIRLEKINNIMLKQQSDLYKLNGFASKLDESFTSKKHIITDQNFESFYFRSAKGKDIFIENLMKPYLKNSCLSRIPKM